MDLTNRPSASLTPATDVFDLHANGSPQGARWVRQDIPNVRTLPNGNSNVEVRGWIRSMEADPGKDPDWHLFVEPDGEWLINGLGMSCGTFVKGGDMTYGADKLVPGGAALWPGATSDIDIQVSTPLMKIELDGWSDATRTPVGRPADWLQFGDGGPAYWPFHPLHDGGNIGSPQFQVGQYVAVWGNLVTDQPHYKTVPNVPDIWNRHPDLNDPYTAVAWRLAMGAADHEETNLSRWTEMHSPDLIKRMPDAQRDGWVRTVILKAIQIVSDANVGGNEKGATFSVPIYDPQNPPSGPVLAQRPGPQYRIAIREYVYLGTEPLSITYGNDSRTGARIVVDGVGTSATITVAVSGTGWPVAAGLFRALYVAYWAIEQSDWRWCSQCQGLFWAGVQNPGRPEDYSAGMCPAGGSHLGTTSSDYRLVMDVPCDPGQHDWRWCAQCQGLFWAGGQDSAGRCPAGGSHLRTTSSDYSLVVDMGTFPGQHDWRWCGQCSGLFWGGGGVASSGTCPAGGSHTQTGTSDYILAMS